ncbi:MAG: rRNA maturation RNase YbeY [Woeseia sp.]|nr:rRNA maturation RNase YbeY [Woeseia sp.]
MQVVCDAGDLPSKVTLGRWPLAVVQHLALQFDRRREITVRIVDANESQQLNKQFRNRDQPTNVLSFPLNENRGAPPGTEMPLGDLVLCAPLITSEASAQMKDVGDHWAHLLVHGTLHLLGYDHEVDSDAEQMEALEVAILANHGIENPYIQRESAG